MKTFKDKMGLAVAALFIKSMRLGSKLSGGSKMAKQAAAPAGELYKFTMKTIDGQDRPLSSYKGKVLMIVNTASLCGLTPQYDSLEELHEKYAAKGFQILGFPANEFGAQEPGSNAEIKEFCRTKYSIGFDLFSKIAVKGAGIHPLYRFLTERSGFPGEIGWNFAKFLVSKDGAIAARFDPEVDPLAKSVTSKVEELLAA